MKTYTIREYQSFSRGRELEDFGFQSMPEKTFDALERFILENQTDVNDDSQAWRFLGISVRRGKKVISAKNYVGLITMNDGTTIEILPKLDNANDEETKRVFRSMLCTAKDLPFKSFRMANVMADKMPLMEIFIRMFLDEVGLLIKRGLKFGYVHRESNEHFLKGRIDFSQHIKQNLIHKEMFYVGYDEFEANRPENKLIKSTLLYLKQRTTDNKNLRDCNRYIVMMADIDESTDFKSDFSKYTSNRNMQEYEDIMNWCRIFLMNKSFTAFKGNEVAFALLFPMERLFESYVADKLKRYMDFNSFRVSAQDRGYHLFDVPKRFALRPDIVVTNKTNKKKVVLDTKWKLLNSNSQANYGISQSDMYQMYAYDKKYKSERAILIYPYNKNIESKNVMYSFTANEDNPVEVKAMFYDLLDDKGSLERIANMIMPTEDTAAGGM